MKRIMVAGAFALFGCNSYPSGPDFLIVEGFVLEYVDATRTTTRPVVEALVEVLLPDGQTTQFCIGVIGPTCSTIGWVSQAFTDLDGHYELSIDEPDHCGLRVRAYSGGNLENFPPTADLTGKTATAPRLASGCENRGTHDGPTLIIE